MKFLLLDANEKIIDAPPIADVLSLVQYLKLQGVDTVEASLVAIKRYTQHLDNVRYFAVSDRDSDHAFYLYRKQAVEVQDREIILNGKDSFWDEMAGAYIKEKRPAALTAPDLVKLVLEDSRWQVDFIDSGFTEKMDTSFYYTTKSDALESITKSMTIDLVPMINIEGHQITRRYVNLYLQAGGDHGRRFVYGKNALTVVKKTDDASVYTALVGRGSSIEETREADDDSGDTTTYNSRKINFADVEWRKSKGDPVDKPKGQEYVEWPQSTALYGYSDGEPRIGIVEFDKETDPKALLEKTWDQLQTTGVPAVQYSATVGDVGFLGRGETVTLVNFAKGIAYKTRVSELKWNRLNENKSQITIGDKLVMTQAERIKSVASSALQGVSDQIARQAASLVTFNNAGVNVSYSQNGELPPNPKEGDLVFIRNSDGSVTMKRYENGQWVIVVDDTTGKQIEAKVNAKMAELDQAMAGNKAAIDANTATQDKLAKDLAASETKVKAALEKAETDTAAAKAQADAAVTKAQANADLITLTEQSAQAAKTAADEAQQLAQKAREEITAAQGDAASAANAATDALKAAQAAQTLAGGANTTAAAASVEVDKVKASIQTLASKADVDALTGEVTGAKTLAEQTAEGLRLKADTSTVNTIRGDVSKLGTDLKVASDKLALTMTRNDVSGMLGPYATQSWAQAQLTATTSEWGTKLSSVRSTLNALGTSQGRNYVRNSRFEKGTENWTFNLQGLKTNLIHSLENKGKPGIHVFGTPTVEFQGAVQTLAIKAAKGQKLVFGMLISFDGADAAVGQQHVGMHYLTADGKIAAQEWHDLTPDDNAKNVYQRYTATFDVLADCESVRLMIYTPAAGTYYNSYYTEISVTIGEVAYGWSAAPEDSTIYTDAKISELKVTIDGLTNTTAKKTDLQLLSNQLSTTVNGLTNLNTEVSNQGTLIASLQTGVNGFNSTISQVKTRLDGLSVGGTNLLTDTETLTGWLKLSGYSAIETDTSVRTVALKLAGKEPPNSGYKSSNAVFLVKGQTYTFSALLKYYSPNPTGAVAKAIMTLFSDYTGQVLGGVGFDVTTTLTDQWEKYSVTFTAQETGQYSQWRVLSYKTGFPGGSIFVAEQKLEVGTVATDWSPAPDDQASTLQVSTIEQTVKGIQTKVAGAATQTQVTQLSDQITSVVGGLGKPNIVINSEFANGGVDWKTQPIVATNKAAGYISNYIGSMYNGSLGFGTNNLTVTGWNLIGESVRTTVLTDAVSASCRIKVYEASANSKIMATVAFFDVDGKRISNFDMQADMNKKNAWQLVSVENFKRPEGAVSIAMQFYEYNGTHTIWSQPYICLSSTLGTYQSDSVNQTQITQLQDAINLRVTKDKIVSQINLSPESILIDGRKTHITGQTTIDAAVIKAANIASIDATKITTGYLDASKVAVVSLSASSLTSGSINAGIIDVFNLNANNLVAGTIDARRISVINLDATQITTGTLNAAKLNVINLNGQSIVGQSITADKMAANAILVGLNNGLNDLTINPNSIEMRENGQRSFVLDKTGIHVYHDYQNEDIGWIHANNMRGYEAINGLEFDLNPAGDYMAWGARDNASSDYLTKLTWARRDGGGLTKGFTFSDQVAFDSTIRVTGAGGSLATTAYTYNGYKYPYFGDAAYRAGFAYGSSQTYLISENIFYNITAIVKAMDRLGTIMIPIQINGDGTVAKWKTVTI